MAGQPAGQLGDAASHTFGAGPVSCIPCALPALDPVQNLKGFIPLPLGFESPDLAAVVWRGDLPFNGVWGKIKMSSLSQGSHLDKGEQEVTRHGQGNRC